MKHAAGSELPEKPCQLHHAVISILRNSILLAASRLQLVLHFRVHDTGASVGSPVAQNSKWQSPDFRLPGLELKWLKISCTHLSRVNLKLQMRQTLGVALKLGRSQCQTAQGPGPGGASRACRGGRHSLSQSPERRCKLPQGRAGPARLWQAQPS